MSIKTKSTLLAVAKVIFLVFIFSFLLFPIYWVIATSLKTNLEAYSFPPTLWPDDLTFQSYINLFTVNNDFFTYYKNNFIVAGCASILVCFIAIFAGYALSRIKIKWNKWVIATLVFSQMFPVVSRLISLYGLMNTFGLLNTHVGLILAVTATQIPFSITLMASFFDNVPKALEEAAYIDGAGRVRTLFQVVAPLVLPGLLAVGLYSFLMTWDDYLHAVTLIQSTDMWTLSQGISYRYLGDVSDWSLVNSISVVSTLPMVFIFFFFQKYMVSGLTQGAVKG
ncbi:MAG: carbohydrate ABC transporter permease [Bacillota bacterium]